MRGRLLGIFLTLEVSHKLLFGPILSKRDEVHFRLMRIDRPSVADTQSQKPP